MKKTFLITVLQILLYTAIYILFGFTDGLICFVIGLLMGALSVLKMYFKGVIYHKNEYEQLKKQLIKNVCDEFEVNIKS